MLRLVLAGQLLLFLADAAYFDACKTPPPVIPLATSSDCPPEDVCDPKFLVVDGCVMACSNGAVKFIDEAGAWTIAQAKVTMNAPTGVLLKSAGGAARSMSKPTCVIDPNFTQPPATPPPSTTQPPTTPPPTPKPVDVEPCGCPYGIEQSNPAFDHTKLFIMNTEGSGKGNCALQCDAGYRLVGKYYTGAIKPATYATCIAGRWYFGNVDDTGSGEFPSLSATFSCEPTPFDQVCSQSYGKAPCRTGQECNPNAIRAIQGAKGCILSCAKGYRLYDTVLSQNMGTVTLNSAGKWLGNPITDVRTTTYYNAEVVITCERYYSPNEKSLVAPPPGALDPCGCWYKAKLCPTCDWKQLFVMDGFGATSGKCTLGCAKGYQFEGGQNLISCKLGAWIGTSRSSMTTAPIPSPQGWIDVSCVPQTVAPTCSLAYTAFDCDGCDKTKLATLASTKGSCTLTCDKGFRLVASNSARAIVRGQEAVRVGDTWKLYPLGEVIAAPLTDPTYQFTCEPAIVIAAPAAPGYGTECGCKTYNLYACAECDNTKLDGRHDGAGTCTLSCAAGYQLMSYFATLPVSLSQATCSAHRWSGRNLKLEDVSTYPYMDRQQPTFACVRTASPRCGSIYAPLTALTTGESSMLRTVFTEQKCQLKCAPEFRLMGNTVNSLTGAYGYSETTSVLADTSTYVWSAAHLITSYSTSFLNATLFVGCERVVPARPPPACGCKYWNVGAGGTHYDKLIYRTTWTENGNCELICLPGFRMKAAYGDLTAANAKYLLTDELSLAVCQAGTWYGRSYDGSKSVALGGRPSIGCRPVAADYKSCAAQVPYYSPYQCPSCTHEAMVQVASGYTCQQTCKAGWRIVASLASGQIVRPRAISATEKEWIGTGGQGLNTLTNFGWLPEISCEADTLPVPAEIIQPVTTPPPKAASCVFCPIQPTKDTACPPGKSCIADFLPLWKTAAGCMQVRCRRNAKMLINRSGTWLTETALNCETNGIWKTASGMALSTTVPITCDASTQGKMELEEILYDAEKAGHPIISG